MQITTTVERPDRGGIKVLIFIAKQCALKSKTRDELRTKNAPGAASSPKMPNEQSQTRIPFTASYGYLIGHDHRGTAHIV